MVPALIAVLVQRQILPSLATRFFIFTGSPDAPRIALAALQAEAFVIWPTLEAKQYATRNA